MYFLVNITIYRTDSSMGMGDRSVETTRLQRLVESKDKNEAWEKVKRFLENEYITDDSRFDIDILDTIV